MFKINEQEIQSKYAEYVPFMELARAFFDVIDKHNSPEKLQEFFGIGDKRSEYLYELYKKVKKILKK